jgi:hypothetical protein
MPKPVTVLALVFVAACLGACLGPEHDPHFLPYEYSLYPGNSPGVMQYSTNPYPAPNAPPLMPGQAGGSFP